MQSMGNLYYKTMASLEANPGITVNAVASLLWDIEVYDGDRLISESRRNSNAVTAEGKNALLNIMFHAATQITTWYVLIFITNYTITGNESYSTLASLGCTEGTAYDESARPEFVEDEAVAGYLDNNASQAAFTVNASYTVYGAGLVGGGSAPNTKGNTAGGGTLYSLARFDAAQPVASGNVVRVAATCGMS